MKKMGINVQISLWTWEAKVFQCRKEFDKVWKNKKASQMKNDVWLT